MATDPNIIKKLNDDLDNLDEIVKSISSQIQSNLNKQLANSSQTIENMVNELDKGNDITKELSSALLKSNTDSKKLGLDQYRIQQQLLDIEKKLGENYTAKLNKQKEHLKSQLEDNAKQQQLNELQGDFLLNLGKINDAEEQNNEEKKKQNNLSESAKKLISDSIKPLVGLASFSGVLKLILDTAFKADAQTTELAKSLGLSKDQAASLRDNFVEYSRASGDAFVTTDKLLEAQSDLRQQLGISVLYSGKQAEDFSRLTKLMGLSAEQAGKLSKLSIINGTSIEGTVKSVIKGSVASQQSNKISIDQREILKDVANLSEGILVKFQGNPEALGKAVVEARKLGTNLETIDKIGDSLLNWESSIENELKAELITGKQLNLEKARYAALTGDQLTLTKEISNQVGSLNDFQNLNVVAQKSLAEAFGLSRDELAKMLMQQEVSNKLGDVSKMTLDQQLQALKSQGEPLDSLLYKQIQQQSAQEKFANAMEKLQDIVGNLLAGPVGHLLDTMSDIAGQAWLIYGAVGAMGGASLSGLISEVMILAGGLTEAGIAAITLESALTLGLGVVGIIAGIATAMAAVHNAKTMPDGIVGPGAKILFTGDEGAIKLNDNDTVIAGTNLGGGNNNAEMISAINDLHATIKSNSNKSSNVYLDGTKVSKSLGGVKTLGTTQLQNTYNLA